MFPRVLRSELITMPERIDDALQVVGVAGPIAGTEVAQGKVGEGVEQDAPPALSLQLPIDGNPHPVLFRLDDGDGPAPGGNRVELLKLPLVS